ncbi:MAG: PIN domain-containing protein [Terracidiphilus sp.]
MFQRTSAHSDWNIASSSLLSIAVFGSSSLRRSFSNTKESCAGPSFQSFPKKITESLAQIRQNSTLVAPATTLPVSPDEQDNRFLECAESAGADFLVTGNRRHFPKVWKKTRIVSTRELVEFVFKV